MAYKWSSNGSHSNMSQMLKKAKYYKKNATTGNPSVLWEFVWEIKSWYGKWNLNEINELKAVKVINKVSILLPGVVVFIFTKFKHNLSTFTFSGFFFASSGKFPAVGSLELSNPPGWGQKKRAMPCPSSTLQHFSPITQSNSVILSIWGSLVKFQEGGIVLKTMLCPRV